MASLRGAALLWGALTLCHAAHARADDVAATAVVTVNLPADAAERVKRVTFELLERFGVRVLYRSAQALSSDAVLAESAVPSDSVARVWIIRAAASRVTLYIGDRSGKRLLVRRIDLRRGFDEVAAEEIGHIVEDAVSALGAGMLIGFERRDTRPPSGTTAPPLQRGRSTAPRTYSSSAAGGLSGSFDLAYSAQVFAPSVPISHGPVAGAGVWYSTPYFAAGLKLSASYSLPALARSNATGARLERYPFALVVEARRELDREWRLGAGLGGVINVMHVTPKALDDGVALDASKTRETVGARTLASIARRATARSWIVLSTGADYELTRVRWYVERSAGRHFVLAPYGASPFLTLGFEMATN